MSLTDKRAQLYLAREQYKKMKQLAKDKNITFAQLTREALSEYLYRNQSRWENDPITKHIGCIEGKDTDLSENHDKYIYGD